MNIHLDRWLIIIIVGGEELQHRRSCCFWSLSGSETFYCWKENNRKLRYLPRVVSRERSISLKVFSFLPFVLLVNNQYGFTALLEKLRSPKWLNLKISSRKTFSSIKLLPNSAVNFYLKSSPSAICSYIIRSIVYCCCLLLKLMPRARWIASSLWKMKVMSMVKKRKGKRKISFNKRPWLRFFVVSSLRRLKISRVESFHLFIIRRRESLVEILKYKI